MVGAQCKSGGKTALACALIDKFRSEQEIVGVKITTVDSFNASHHPEVAEFRKNDVCMGPYYITEEKVATNNTDTGKMLTAGAKRVFWLLSLKSHLARGVRLLLDTLGENTVSICESNRARSVIEPGVFLMVNRLEDKNCKPSAAEVLKYADRVVLSNGARFDIDMGDIQLLKGRWMIRNINTGTGHC